MNLVGRESIIRKSRGHDNMIIASSCTKLKRLRSYSSSTRIYLLKNQVNWYFT